RLRLANLRHRHASDRRRVLVPAATRPVRIAGAGLAVVALAACTSTQPEAPPESTPSPTAAPTTTAPSPSPTPTPSAADGQYGVAAGDPRSEEHTSELQSRENLVCRLLLEKKKKELII